MANTYKQKYVPISLKTTEQIEKLKEYRKKYYNKNRDLIVSKSKKYREETNHSDLRKKHIFNGIASRCRKNNIEFNLKFEDLVFPDFCPILGIPLFFKKGKKCDNTPSVDRLDPSKGYIKENVMVISFRANRIKNNATAKELKAIAEWMNNGSR